MKVELKDVIQCITDEPELPGDMPDKMVEALLNSDKKTLEFYSRSIIKLTKEGILDRINLKFDENDLEG